MYKYLSLPGSNADSCGESLICLMSKSFGLTTTHRISSLQVWLLHSWQCLRCRASRILIAPSCERSLSLCLGTVPPVTAFIIDTSSGTTDSLYCCSASLNAWWSPTVPGGENACGGPAVAELLAEIVGAVCSPVANAEAQWVLHISL